MTKHQITTDPAFALSALLGGSKILKTFAGIFILIFLSSCENLDADKIPEQGIKHNLRKFNVKTTTSEHSSAWYFLVMGGYSSSKSEQTNVRFYFRNCKGEYQFQELPLRKIRIKTDSTVAEPFIIFEVGGVTGNPRNRCYELDYEWMVSSATIYCKETDFQPEININDLR
jgi:hypothetical protein